MIFWFEELENLIRQMKQFYICIFTFFCFTKNTFSQTTGLGSWNIINLQYSHNTKLSFFGEAQLRSLKFYNHFHYYEYKAGFMYKVNPDLKVGLGGGSYQTFKEGGDFLLPKNNNEFRLWPQVILTQNIGKIKVEQRYRAEMRFTTMGYRKRFRYRLGLSYNFGKTKIGYKPFLIGLSNELFFTNNEPYFERNRFLVSLTYKPTKTTSIQLGYLHQFDYKINDETGRDFFQIGYFIELNSR